MRRKGADSRLAEAGLDVLWGQEGHVLVDDLTRGCGEGREAREMTQWGDETRGQVSGGGGLTDSQGRGRGVVLNCRPGSLTLQGQFSR